MYIFNSCIKSKEHFSFEMFVVSSIYFADSTSNIYFCCLWAQALSRMIWRPLGSCLRIWMSHWLPTKQWLWLDPIKALYCGRTLKSYTVRGENQLSFSETGLCIDVLFEVQLVGLKWRTEMFLQGLPGLIPETDGAGNPLGEPKLFL